MKEVVIVSACRTPIGSFGGSLKSVSAADLGAITVKEAIKRAGIAPELVEEVVYGNVLSENSSYGCTGYQSWRCRYYRCRRY